MNKPDNIQFPNIEKKEQSVESIDLWYQIVNEKIGSDNYDQKMEELLQAELPKLSSLIMERTCNLSCLHCAFQDEKSSSEISKDIDLESKILNITSQLPDNSAVVHEGRILKDWHVDILQKIKTARPDLSIGLIDNGSYLKQKNKLNIENFKFNWIDISVDGTKEIHNQQRNNKLAYDMAINGLEQARNFSTDRVTSLFTVTEINHNNVYEAAKVLIDRKLIDEFYVVPQGPTFRKDDLLMDIDEWKVFWEDLKKTYQLGLDKGVQINFKIYRPEDVKNLAKVVGFKNFMAAFSKADNIMAGMGTISFELDGVMILYQPASISCTETFAIDVDGAYRLPYCVKYTLDQLNKKENADYTVDFIRKDDSFEDLYKKGAAHWWQKFGKTMLQDEIKVFREIKNLSDIN